MSVMNQVRGVAARWWPVPLLALVGVAGAGVYSVATPVQYTASAYVVATVTTSVSTPQGDTQLALGFAQAYARITGQADITGPAAATAGRTPEWLRSHVQSSSSPNAPIIQITGTASTAGEAADMANAVAKSLADYGTERSSQTRVSVSVFSQATPPDQPATPGMSIVMTIGAAAGGLLGLFSVLSRNPARTRTVAAAKAPIPAPAAPADPVKELVKDSTKEPIKEPVKEPKRLFRDEIEPLPEKQGKTKPASESEDPADALEQLFADQES